MPVFIVTVWDFKKCCLVTSSSPLLGCVQNNAFNGSFLSPSPGSNTNKLIKVLLGNNNFADFDLRGSHISEIDISQGGSGNIGAFLAFPDLERLALTNGEMTVGRGNGRGDDGR